MQLARHGKGVVFLNQTIKHLLLNAVLSERFGDAYIWIYGFFDLILFLICLVVSFGFYEGLKPLVLLEAAFCWSIGYAK